MRNRALGSTGLAVSQIGFGSWPIAGSRGILGYGSCDPEIARATIEAALSGGVTLYDTADVYGDGFAESLLGEVLEPFRQGVVICTKGGWDISKNEYSFSPAFLDERIRASLERLRSDYIDIYLLHNPPAHLIGIKEIYYPLLKLRDRGLLRHIGISVTHPDDAVLALEIPEIEVIEVPYNLLFQDAERRFFPLARDSGVGIIVREALGNGILTGKYSINTRFAVDDFRSNWPPHLVRDLVSRVHHLQVFKRDTESMSDLALRFVLDKPEIASVVVGARSSQQLSENLRAGSIAPSLRYDVNSSEVIAASIHN